MTLQRWDQRSVGSDGEGEAMWGGGVRLTGSAGTDDGDTGQARSCPGVADAVEVVLAHRFEREIERNLINRKPSRVRYRQRSEAQHTE